MNPDVRGIRFRHATLEASLYSFIYFFRALPTVADRRDGGLSATSVHATTHAVHRRLVLISVGNQGDDRFRGQQKRGNGRGVLECRSDNLGWVDYTGVYQVLVLLRLRIEALFL